MHRAHNLISVFSLPLLLFSRPALSLPQDDSAPTSTPPSAAPSTSPEWSDDDAFRDAILNSTNTYRAAHNASAVDWNETSAEAAQRWADRCTFKHSGGPTGENIATGYGNATGSVEAWGNENATYSFSDAGFDTATGHFTQLVWRDTTSVGCARADCGEAPEGGELEEDENGDKKAWGWFLVCEYFPPGNVVGGYEDNVQEAIGGAWARRGMEWWGAAVVSAVAAWAAW